jgi:transposase
MRKIYPSDPTREQFEKIRDLLENAKKKTSPRTLDLYDVFCAVVYVLKSGCPWRMLPGDFPKWKTVYMYFQTWNAEIGNEPSVLEKVLKKISGRGAAWRWAKRKNILLHCRCTEC